MAFLHEKTDYSADEIYKIMIDFWNAIETGVPSAELWKVFKLRMPNLSLPDNVKMGESLFLTMDGFATDIKYSVRDPHNTDSENSSALLTDFSEDGRGPDDADSDSDSSMTSSSDTLPSRALIPVDTTWLENYDCWIADWCHLRCVNLTWQGADLRPDLCITNKLLHPETKLVSTFYERVPVFNIMGTFFRIPIYSWLCSYSKVDRASAEIAAQVLTANNVNVAMSDEVIENKVIAAVAATSTVNYDRFGPLDLEPKFVQQGTINLCLDISHKLKYENRHRDFLRGRVAQGLQFMGIAPTRLTSLRFLQLRTVLKYAVLIGTLTYLLASNPVWRYLVRFWVLLIRIRIHGVIIPYSTVSFIDLLGRLPYLIASYLGVLDGSFVSGYTTTLTQLPLPRI
jgi:hypothetical protein